MKNENTCIREEIFHKARGNRHEKIHRKLAVLVENEIGLLRNLLAKKDIVIQFLKEENQKYIKIIFGKRSERRHFDAIAKEQSSFFNEAENAAPEGNS